LLQSVALLGGIAPADAANTAAATSPWIDVRHVVGDIRVIVDVGVVAAGSITPTIEDADNGSGDNNAAVTPVDGAFTAVTPSNDPLRQVRHVQSNAVRGWIRVVGTIATGPAQVAVTVEGR
jgi:hypothetical protein